MWDWYPCNCQVQLKNIHFLWIWVTAFLSRSPWVRCNGCERCFARLLHVTDKEKWVKWALLICSYLFYIWGSWNFKFYFWGTSATFVLKMILFTERKQFSEKDWALGRFGLPYPWLLRVFREWTNRWNSSLHLSPCLSNKVKQYCKV